MKGQQHVGGAGCMHPACMHQAATQHVTNSVTVSGTSKLIVSGLYAMLPIPALGKGCEHAAVPGPPSHTPALPRVDLPSTSTEQRSSGSCPYTHTQGGPLLQASLAWKARHSQGDQAKAPCLDSSPCGRLLLKLALDCDDNKESLLPQLRGLSGKPAQVGCKPTITGTE